MWRVGAVGLSDVRLHVTQVALCGEPEIFQAGASNAERSSYGPARTRKRGGLLSQEAVAGV